jgi:PBP1b-binding outer membrane lipoprotein LpoB
MPTTKRCALLVTVAVALTAASCGGDDDGATAESTAPTNGDTTASVDTTSLEAAAGASAVARLPEGTTGPGS